MNELAWEALVVNATPLVASCLGTALVLWIARRRRLYDVPNERSSHAVPTPRSGGLAIVGAILLMWLVAAAVGRRPDRFDALLLTPAVVIACAVGFLDDLRTLRPRLKMLALLLAAGCALVVERVQVAHGVPFAGDVDLGWAAWPLTLFWVACYPNAFNFMDGLNGIASLTAIVSGVAFAAAGARGHGDGPLYLMAVSVVLSCVGFLPWNFPKGRIFMGDAGSLPLGLLLACCAVRANATGAMSFPASLLLLGPYLFDVTFTLIRRKRQGHVIGEAHKDHLYQRLSRLLGGSHPKSALAFAGMAVATGALALAYDSMSEPAKLLSLVLPVACLLAFAALVQRAEARRSAAGER